MSRTHFLIKSLVVGASLSLMAGGAALAQTSPQASDPTAPPSDAQPMNPQGTMPSASPQTLPDAATAPAMDVTKAAKPGMMVKDTDGTSVGTVVRVAQTAGGQNVIVVKVDGKPLSLPTDVLTASADGGLVSSVSKAKIKAAAAGQG